MCHVTIFAEVERLYMKRLGACWSRLVSTLPYKKPLIRESKSKCGEGMGWVEGIWRMAEPMSAYLLFLDSPKEGL